MNFSESVRISNCLAPISPNGLYIACASQHRVVLRTVDSLQVFRAFSCVDIVYDLLWSFDSLFILSVLKKRGIVQVLSLENPDWICKIDEGSAGLLNAVWAPDGRHFLTTTDFYLRITVWSISEVSVSYLKFPKACVNNLSFSPGGRYLALLERRNFQDHLSLFDCGAKWSLVKNVQLDTVDAVGLQWSPDGRFIAIWDDCLRYRVAIYSVDVRHLHTFCAYNPGQDLLGVKSVAWSHTGQLLAIGSYDQKCRILNNFNWTCLACLTHPVDKQIDPSLGLSPSGRILKTNTQMNSGDDDVPTYRPHRIDVYEECSTDGITKIINQTGLRSDAYGSLSTVQYQLINKPVTIHSTKPDLNQPSPKIGIGLMAFSSDSRFLATRNDNASHVIWIWSIDRRLSLFSLLIHNSGSVNSMMWDPTLSMRLALCTNSDTVFLWTPQGCLAVQTPMNFNFEINSLRWSPNGNTIQLLSDTQFCLCYLDVDQNVEDHEDNKIRQHRPLWKPPCSDKFSYMRKSEPDLTLPFGDFGIDIDQNTNSSIEKLDNNNNNNKNNNNGDTPNWLRCFNQDLSNSTVNQQSTRRRSLSSSNCGEQINLNRKIKSKSNLMNSANSKTTTTNRQLWKLPSSSIKPAHKTSLAK